MPRIPYYDVENATGKHAEFLGKLGTHMNIYRMLANSENGLKGFIRMGNALLYKCELDPVLRELAIIRVGRLSRAAYEVFQHERIGREAGVAEEKIAALRDATIEAPAFSDNEKAVLRYTDDVVRPFDVARDLKDVDLVGISADSKTARRSYDIATAYRQRGVKVVLGGIHPTACPEEAMAHADSVVVGEAEDIWPTVVAAKAGFTARHPRRS